MSSVLTPQFIQEYTRYNATIEKQGKRVMCAGMRDGKPVKAHPCSWLVSGQTGQGKSSIASFLTLWFLTCGASFVLIDPHARNEERSLALKLAPLARWRCYPVIDCLDTDVLMDTIEWLERELKAREYSMAGKQVLLVLIDEWNELLTGCSLTNKQADRIVDVISNIARGGGKFGMYALVCLHNTDLESSGGPTFRRNFLGRVACAAEWREMSNALNDSDLKRIKGLALSPVMRPGDALIKVTGQSMMRVRYPYTDEQRTAQFAAIIAPLIFKSSNDSDAFLPEIDSLNGASIHPNISSPTPLISPPHVSNPVHIYHPNGSTKTIRISDEDYQQILTEGKRQLRENEQKGYRGVHRGRLKETLGWGNKNQANSKIKCIADEQGWEYYSEAELSEEERQAILARANHICTQCGSDDDLTVDHRTPRSKGGGNEPDNLQVLCRSCNSSKGITTTTQKERMN